MAGPHFGIIPRRVAALRLPRRVHAVLDVIACHAREGRARLSRDTIAREAGIDRSKVSFCTRHLKAKGVLEVVGRGGRGLASHYRIIPDEEAFRRQASQPTAQTHVAAHAPPNGANSDTETARNSADFGSKTVPILALNGAISGTPTEIEQNLEQNLPFGEGRARAREGGHGLQSLSVRRQPELLLPFDGAKACSTDSGALDPFDTFQPGPDIFRLAQTVGVENVDMVICQWKDWHRKDKKPYPADAQASLRRWISNEPRFARQRSRPSLVEAVFADVGALR
jgi:hypothetical protein